MRTINRKIRCFYDRINPNSGVILMLHRVVDKLSIIEDNRKLEVTPSFLEKTILNYKEKGYRFLNIDEVYNEHINYLPKRKPYICFTFDDGYKDNLTHALPIFQKYNIQFTIYIATGFPDKTVFVWWYWLENLIVSINNIVMETGERFKIETVEEKNRIFMLIKSKIHLLKNAESRKFIVKLYALNNLPLHETVEPLDWNDIQLLLESKLCSIASHGINHTSLCSIRKDELRTELVNSKRILENRTGNVIKHFAYPYGHYNKHIILELKKSGYLSAVKIDGGMQRKNQNVFVFKRLILNEL